MRMIRSTLVLLIAMALPAACDDAAPESGELPVVRVFGEVGTNPGQFTYPRVLTNDGRNLWAIDKSARVQRLDPETGASSALWTMPDWEHGKPCGAGVGPDGKLYIADTHYFRVMVYEPPAALGDAPKLVGSFGSLGPEPGHFRYVTDVGILCTADGTQVERLYVGEYGGNDRISVFDREYRLLFTFGTFGSGTDPAHVEFSRPQSIEVDQERRRLIVTDACNHRIGVFDLEGKLVRWIGSPETAGAGPDQFAYPYGLALLGDGTALVTEFGNHRVHHVDYESGHSLGVLGAPGRGRGQLTNPWAITILNDMVFVLDSGNDRVQAFKAPPRRGTGVRG